MIGWCWKRLIFVKMILNNKSCLCVLTVAAATGTRCSHRRDSLYHSASPQEKDAQGPEGVQRPLPSPWSSSSPALPCDLDVPIGSWISEQGKCEGQIWQSKAQSGSRSPGLQAAQPCSWQCESAFCPASELYFNGLQAAAASFFYLNNLLFCSRVFEKLLRSFLD